MFSFIKKMLTKRKLRWVVRYYDYKSGLCVYFPVARHHNSKIDGATKYFYENDTDEAVKKIEKFLHNRRYKICA